MSGVAVTPEWIVLEEFESDGAFHMHRDESLALERVHDSGLPNILRLYSWRPAALSLGYQQRMESVDVLACADRGIDVVRRPTGGRAVLHKNELTYAVIWRVPFDIGINASHNLIVEALVASLSDLGAAGLELSDPRATIKEEYRPGSLSNAACFLSTSRHEVTFDGRKTIGSAQRRFGNVLLQHGSILLNKEHLLLPELLELSEDDRGRMRVLLERQTSDLSQVFGREISIKDAANSISSTFVTHICSAAESFISKAV
ncbi:MAG TPA: lipoate--protein ligase family protein [Candidatus Kapabacteria bacterium]|nr:lipoate--protein ligase family protein [Candidatus Kapabacteria bacterium]